MTINKKLVGVCAVLVIAFGAYKAYDNHCKSVKYEIERQKAVKEIAKQKAIESLEAARKVINNPDSTQQDYLLASNKLVCNDASNTEEGKPLYTILQKKLNITDKYSLTKAGQKIHAKYPEWDTEVCNKVGKGNISIGMTTAQVKAAWGNPYRVNTTTTANGVSEQWVMRESGSSYVYFEDGRVTTIQN
jgi:hypothetical protein